MNIKDHYAAFLEGRITEDELARLERVAHAPVRKRYWPTRCRPRVSPARERTRRMAYAGPLPPALAARFTVSQMAVLKVVGPRCDRSVQEIAQLAGVSIRTVQYTLRIAQQEGLLTVTERRQTGAKNLPNLVTVVSREWLQWLKRGSGCKEVHPLINSYLTGADRCPEGRPPGQEQAHAPKRHQLPRRKRRASTQGELPFVRVE